jgi:hypothetical protein
MTGETLLDEPLLAPAFTASQREAQADPEQLLVAERALDLGAASVRAGRPIEEIERALLYAAQAGRDANSPEGLIVAATALLNLGLARAKAKHPVESVESVLRDADLAGSAADSPDGFLRSAMALYFLGVVIARAGRSTEEVEHVFRNAAEAGRKTGTPEGSARAARALLSLGELLQAADRPWQEVARPYREAARRGRKSTTRDGLLTASNALNRLATVFRKAGRPPREVERAYRAARVIERRLNPGGRVLLSPTIEPPLTRPALPIKDRLMEGPAPNPPPERVGQSISAADLPRLDRDRYLALARERHAAIDELVALLQELSGFDPERHPLSIEQSEHYGKRAQALLNVAGFHVRCPDCQRPGALYFAKGFVVRHPGTGPDSTHARGRDDPAVLYELLERLVAREPPSWTVGGDPAGLS